MMAELACLALAVYYEARSETLQGQIAVAQVIMNRVADPRYPKTICEVVQQGPTSPTGMPLRHRCQFSFWCDGLGEDPRDVWAWKKAQAVASIVYDGQMLLPELAGVLYYTRSDVAPEWSESMKLVATIGSHVFLKEQR